MNLKGNYRRTCLAIAFIIITNAIAWPSDTLRVGSPSGKILVKVWMGKQLTYSISYNGKTILAPSLIDLILENDRSLSSGNSIRSSSIKKINEQIISPVPEKRKIIPDVYNLLSVTFRQSYKVEFRVYDDGAAYRISTLYKDSVKIKNEVAEFCFPGKPSVYFPKIQKKEDADIFHTSYEEEYPLRKMDSLLVGMLGYTPVLVTPESDPKIGITESDLEDYPGMFLEGTGTSKLKAVFAVIYCTNFGDQELSMAGLPDS
jgi:alpha-glucosidase